MKMHFELDEFYKEDVVISGDIATKINVFRKELNPIREKLNSAITISRNSGYRPVAYELSKGRSGNSQHCFKGRGAVDLTCSAEKFQELYNLLIEDSRFTRICLYPDKMFIHCDFKESGHRLYIDTGNDWERVN